MNTRGQKSIIDFIIHNSNIHPTRVTDVRVLSSANVGTDHGLVLMKITMCLELNATTKNSSNSNKVEKFNIESFIHPSTKHLYQSRLRDKIHSNKILPSDSVNDA